MEIANTLKDELISINGMVFYKDKMAVAVKLDIGLSTVYDYLKGEIRSDRTARKIIKEFNNIIAKR